MENLKAEMSALRGEVKTLRQVLEGFEGFGGLVRQVIENDKRIKAIESARERTRGTLAAISSACGLLGAGLAEIVIHKLFGN